MLGAARAGEGGAGSSEEPAGCGNPAQPRSAPQHGRVEAAPGASSARAHSGEQYLLWKGEQLLSKILIVAVRLKYLLQVENRDVSMKSLMIKSRQLPRWPESTSSGSLDALSPEEHEK